MKEDFLQYLWKFKKFELCNLKTTQNEDLILHHVGVHNINNSGPDFFDARVSINGQKWAGNVEVHIKSNDWYVHNHENDSSYDNVILHVVWEDTVQIFRNDNSIIPTLQLKDYVEPELLVQYNMLFEDRARRWIPCEKQLPDVSEFIISNWQERLYFERLEQKSILILELLRKSSNNWEAVLFKLLFKNFGLKVNGEAFLSVANSLDFSEVRKCSQSLIQLEALFFGQSGLLESKVPHEYVVNLQKEYSYLKTKFGLDPRGVIPFQFFRLRPPNFPTVRLAQLAMLYFKNDQLFSKVIHVNNIQEYYDLFKVNTSEFWESHYTFGKESKKTKKNITKSFIDLLLINTIIPIRFIYAKNRGIHPEEDILSLISQLSYEKNNIIDKFITLKTPMNNALHSQAMIQLKNEYCDEHGCLRCQIGNYLLDKECKPV
ncbi:DUF2851 family protein [Aquimarina pacifica]|uniref:DUF2851 family protein n=1 Tax=Aquimarina pacifica TaxID=1296415 RepID=UPI00046EFE84|nr:DUF2851 family protein [Aquimarina pacifica]